MRPIDNLLYVLMVIIISAALGAIIAVYTLPPAAPVYRKVSGAVEEWHPPLEWRPSRHWERLPKYSPMYNLFHKDRRQFV